MCAFLLCFSSRSQKHQEETVGYEDRSSETSFDLFKTKPSPLRTSMRLRNQSTKIQSPSTHRNSSLVDDLWSDDDIGDESFVRVTQAVVEQNGFVSPVRASPKCRIGNKSKSPGRRFTFTLDANTEHSVLPTTKNFPVTPSVSDKATSASIPHQNMRAGLKIGADNISSSLSCHSPLVIAPTPQGKTGKNGIQQHHCIPSGGKATATGGKVQVIPAAPKQSTNRVNTSCNKGNIQATCSEQTCEMNRKADSTCQKSNYTFKQVNSLVRNPCPNNRQINSNVNETGDTFKLPVSTVPTAARGYDQHMSSTNKVRNVSGIKKQLPVVSSSNQTNMNLSWAPSQFIATSTQLTSPGGHKQQDNEHPSKYNCDELRNNKINNHGIMSTVTMPMEQNSAKTRTLTTVQPKPISDSPHGSDNAAQTTTGPHLDVSISDDLLATLAEPDDLLDSQACLELLQSPVDHVASSSESRKQEPVEEAFKEKIVDPNSTEMDHLDFFLMEHDRHKHRKNSSTKSATESKGNLDVLFIICFVSAKI